MPGPLQYGNGFKSMTVDLVVSQMVPLNRCAGLIYTMSGIKLSEATCLKYIGQAYHSLDSWEDGKEYLLTCPALHSMQVFNNKNWWLHDTDGLVHSISVASKEAMDDFV